MKAVAEIQVQPIGTGVSTRNEVQEAIEVMREAGFETQTHALGTEIEGELDEILAAVRRIHERLHSGGTPRISTSLTIHTRIDKQPGLGRAVEAVDEPPLLQGPPT